MGPPKFWNEPVRLDTILIKETYEIPTTYRFLNVPVGLNVP